jgi:cyclic pyranopterin phosphate synthase
VTDGSDGDPEGHGGERSTDGDPDDLTHVEDGEARMVGVGEKPRRRRRASARGEIRLRPETVEAVRADDVGKGSVLTVARVGAIQAVKRTPEAIPMCHGIAVTDVDTEFSLGERSVALTVTVETTDRTGPEMEALEGVTTGLNVVWDMVKAVEKVDGAYPETRIEAVEVLEKSKGDPVGE